MLRVEALGQCLTHLALRTQTYHTQGGSSHVPQGNMYFKHTKIELALGSGAKNRRRRSERPPGSRAGGFRFYAPFFVAAFFVAAFFFATRFRAVGGFASGTAVGSTSFGGPNAASSLPLLTASFRYHVT